MPKMQMGHSYCEKISIHVSANANYVYHVRMYKQIVKHISHHHKPTDTTVIICALAAGFWKCMWIGSHFPHRQGAPHPGSVCVYISHFWRLRLRLHLRMRLRLRLSPCAFCVCARLLAYALTCIRMPMQNLDISCIYAVVSTCLCACSSDYPR